MWENQWTKALLMSVDPLMDLADLEDQRCFSFLLLMFRKTVHCLDICGVGWRDDGVFSGKGRTSFCLKRKRWAPATVLFHMMEKLSMWYLSSGEKHQNLGSVVRKPPSNPIKNLWSIQAGWPTETNKLWQSPHVDHAGLCRVSQDVLLKLIDTIWAKKTNEHYKYWFFASSQNKKKPLTLMKRL